MLQGTLPGKAISSILILHTLKESTPRFGLWSLIHSTLLVHPFVFQIDTTKAGNIHITGQKLGNN